MQSKEKPYYESCLSSQLQSVSIDLIGTLNEIDQFENRCVLTSTCGYLTCFKTVLVYAIVLHVFVLFRIE